MAALNSNITTLALGIGSLDRVSRRCFWIRSERQHHRTLTSGSSKSTERIGDEIFIFGFRSRGAYTARALSGLISICGLLEARVPNLHKGNSTIGTKRVNPTYAP